MKRVRGLSMALAFAAWAIVTVNQAAQESIRIGYFPNITHAQALYGKATREFEKQTGADIKWISFNAGPTAIESLFANEIDATYIGPGPAINGFMKSRGEKFVIVAGAASGGSGLVIRADSGINSAKDFNNRKIGTPQLGNTQDIAARVWFAQNNYKLKEKGGTVELISIANPDQLILFKKKEIDGAWTVEPWLSRLELEASGKLFVDEKTLWPGGRYVTTHLLVSKAFLQKNPEMVKKILSAHIDITQKINNDKTAAGAILNAQLSKETGKSLKQEVVTRAMERVEFTWDPITTSVYKDAQSAYQIGFLRTPPDLQGIYALDSLNAVLAQKNLPPVKGK